MYEISFVNKILKRFFDILFSIVLLSFTCPFILFFFFISCFETKSFGLYKQNRVGYRGKLFKIYKIKTMYDPIIQESRSSISVSGDPCVTKSGAFIRRFKIDELPQLFNILIGDMSFVGPRPDVPGYADKLVGLDACILNVRPGITGPASIKYKEEDFLLSKQADPKKYNDEVIWPDKVAINLTYIKNYSLCKDFIYILRTL